MLLYSVNKFKLFRSEKEINECKQLILKQPSANASLKETILQIDLKKLNLENFYIVPKLLGDFLLKDMERLQKKHKQILNLAGRVKELSYAKLNSTT